MKFHWYFQTEAANLINFPLFNPFLGSLPSLLDCRSLINFMQINWTFSWAFPAAKAAREIYWEYFAGTGKIVKLFSQSWERDY